MISCSYLEIYKEVVRDLLQPSDAKPAGLAIREAPGKGADKGVFVEGLSQVCMYVKSRRHLHTRVHARTGPRRHARDPACRRTPRPTACGSLARSSLYYTTPLLETPLTRLAPDELPSYSG